MKIGEITTDHGLFYVIRINFGRVGSRTFLPENG